MADSPYISNVTSADFSEKVLEASRRVPVLVDFWAAWCQPCQMLMPVLQRLVEEYSGALLLAKVDTDAQQALAGQYGVRSLPTVKLFRDGAVVDEFMGVQPESAIRAIVDRHVVRESDHLRERAREATRRGELEEALALLEQALTEDPNSPRVRLDLAQLRATLGNAAGARELLQSLPPDERDKPEVKQLLGRLFFAEQAEDSPGSAELNARLESDPADSAARLQLAALRILGNDYEGGMDQLLELMRRDRNYQDEAGRRGLLSAFELLGEHELVNRYRRKMFQLLH